MKNNKHISVIIPTLNEEQSIGKVITDIPGWVDDIIVVDNGSTDRTVAVAEEHGARTIPQPERGYGAACLKGISVLKSTSIVVFLDGDYSDHPEEMEMLIVPILDDRADLVIGSRVAGHSEKGALTPQAVFGNWLATRLMRLFWGVKYTDLGPFRAISYPALESLQMKDRNFGWTVEMQIKAAQRGLRECELPVRYRKRIGKSKISGTLYGVFWAGTIILTTIFTAAWDWHIGGAKKQMRM